MRLFGRKEPVVPPSAGPMQDPPAPPPVTVHVHVAGSVLMGGLCCDAGVPGSGICEHGSCECGAGQPCGYCCSPIPEDGTTSILVAFTPDWKRARS